MHLDKYRTPAGGYTTDDGDWHETALELVMQGMLGFCGCGRSTDAAHWTRDVLAHIDAAFQPGHVYETWKVAGDKLASEGALYFAYYVFAQKELTEHGGSVPGWLSDKGKHVLGCLNEAIDLEPTD